MALRLPIIPSGLGPNPLWTPPWDLLVLQWRLLPSVLEPSDGVRPRWRSGVRGWRGLRRGAGRSGRAASVGREPGWAEGRAGPTSGSGGEGCCVHHGHGGEAASGADGGWREGDSRRTFPALKIMIKNG